MAEKVGKSNRKASGPHPEVLKTLLSKCDRLKADMDKPRGELGAAVKDAEDTHGINRKAFKLCLSLNRMELDQRADFIRSFRDYCNKLGFNDQPNMFADDETGDTGEDAVDEGAATGAANAEAIQAGIKPTKPRKAAAADAVH